MTANKRFISKESVLTDGFVIVDTLKQYTFPVLEATDNYSIMKALNELNEENEQLKKENWTLKLLVQNWEALDEEKDGQLDKQNQALKKLKKENEQLKKENQMLKHTIGRNENYIVRLTHKGEWKDTSKPLYRSISRGD